MAREELLQVRLSLEERALLDAAAVAAGHEKVSSFVRSLIRQAVGPGIAEQVNESMGEIVVKRGGPKRQSGECSRAPFHRPGTFCSTCGTTPGKKGE